MSKKDRRKDAIAGEEIQTLSIDAILAQLASMKDNALSFMVKKEDADPIWAADVAACEAATAILSALQDEGVRTPEEVRDLVHDYKALAEQYRKMHRRHEEPEKPIRLGKTPPFAYLCPSCNTRNRPGNNFCFHCGKPLDWGR